MRKLWNKNYLIILASMLNINIGLTMVSATITSYIVYLGYTLTIATVLNGAMTISSMCTRPFSGVIGDLFSKKRVVVVSILISAMVLLVSAFTTNSVLLLFLRIAYGIMFSISTTVMMAMVGDYIPQERMGEGLGYYGVGLGVAQAVGPWLGIELVRQLSYQATFLGAVVLTIIAGVLLLLLDCKANCVEKKKKEKNYFHIKNMIAPEILPLLPVCFSIGSVIGIENSYLAIFAAANGIENIGWYFTIYGIGMIVVRLLAGKIIDRCHFRTTLIYGSFLLILAYLGLGTANGTHIVVFFAAAAIFRSIAIGILQPSVQKKCLKTVSLEKQGVASGMYYLGSDLGMGTAPIIGAAIYNSFHNNYRSIFFVYAFLVIVVLVIYFGFAYKSAAKNGLGECTEKSAE